MNAQPATIQAGSSTTLLNHLATNPTNGTRNQFFTFRVYLSTNDVISSADTLLSTQGYSWNFGAMSSVRLHMAQVTIPVNTPAGNYWLGVEYDCATTDANCSNNATNGWDAVPITVTAAPTYTLNVNSSGASGVSISATPSTYAGTTNYSRSGIAGGTSITLTAPASSGGANFSSWSGCDSTSNRNCTVSMTQNRTVTVNYSPTDCQNHLTLQNRTVTGQETHEACQTITAGPSFTVMSTGNATFRAGQRITLRPGFRVQAGGRFQAAIDPGLIQSVAAEIATHSPASIGRGDAGSTKWSSVELLTWRELPPSLRSQLAARDAVIRDAQQSADGSVIVFATDTALVAEDDNDHSDIYHYDVDADILTVISKNPAGYAADGPSHSPRLSGNGQQVVYISIATDLVAGVSNEYAQLYHHDPVFGTTTRLTETTSGQPGAGDSGQVILAEDWVIYHTEATNLDPSGPGIYRQHLHDGQRQVVGLDEWSVPDPRASHPAADDHGEQIVYQRPDGMDRQQIYLNDLLLVERLSLHGDSAFGLLDHCCAALSADGRFLAYREQGTQGPAWLHVLDRDTDRFARLPWPENDKVQYRPPQFRHDATELWWPALEQGPNLPEVLHRVGNPLAD